MQETEASFRFTFQPTPISPYRLQQMKGADDIGLDEIFRAMNAAINL